DYGTGEGRFSARRVPGSDGARGPIIGSYALYLLMNPAGARVSSMSITSGSADGFHISGNDGSGWMGDGRMDGVEGFYEWRFNDGRTGRTTIVVHSDGSLRGHVSGSGLDWWYFAVPVRSLPQKEYARELTRREKNSETEDCSPQEAGALSAAAWLVYSAVCCSCLSNS